MSDNKLSYIIFDDPARDHLLPFTFIRPSAEIRIGILTIREKWEKWMHQKFSHLTQDYLQEKYPLNAGDDNMLINGTVTPNRDLVDEINTLEAGEVLMKDSLLIAGRFERSALELFDQYIPDGYRVKQSNVSFLRISRPWNIFFYNGPELISDYELITAGRTSARISETNNLINADKIFAEEGARLEYVTLNASTGPVYIGADAEIMEGALIRGPFALCERSVVKMGTKIYGPTTIGPYSKVGGEVTNTVLFSYSNKVHEGYLGNSVIGEWCNIGADSNTSNLKNNYALVKLWSYVTGRAEETGLQFCGLMMGDYSKCGINTMFNTGTMVGVSSNIYGAGFPGNFIPSFSWGGAAGFETYRVDKSFETIGKAMLRRNIELSEIDKRIITSVYRLTDRYRKSV
jgi:UDP-N-acetylglucosamine diphosphorylase/glucosamine-1-phosphate N-acetyltransferase